MKVLRGTTFLINVGIASTGKNSPHHPVTVVNNQTQRTTQRKNKMPSMNGKAYDMAMQLCLDVLTLKIGETLDLNFKDEPMTLQRVK